MAEVKGAPLYISFSAGIATKGGLERFNSSQDLLQAADDMPYRSTHTGRNRVTARSFAGES
jgi:PleD family two-component response regulator